MPESHPATSNVAFINRSRIGRVTGAVLQNEEYWHKRAFSETTAAIRAIDPRVEAAHAELALRYVRNALTEREIELELLATPDRRS